MIKIKTKNGIYLDLRDSTYTVKEKEFIFHFSSEFNMNKFLNNKEDYLKYEEIKLINKYGISVDYSLMLLLAFYSKIEKRGFLIYDCINKVYIEQSYKLRVVC